MGRKRLNVGRELEPQLNLYPVRSYGLGDVVNVHASRRRELIPLRSHVISNVECGRKLYLDLSVRRDSRSGRVLGSGRKRRKLSVSRRRRSAWFRRSEEHT